MPRTTPAALVAETKRKSGLGLIALLDLYLTDGTTYYWTDWAGTYPVKIGVGVSVYQPYIKSSGSLRRARNLQTDAGDITLQNLSGNTIDRDVAKLIRQREFEGAFAVLRVWSRRVGLATEEFHGTLTNESADSEQVSFRLVQLMDAQQIDVAENEYQEKCRWRFKSKQCGSTSLNVFCTKVLGPGANDCTAVERFTGCPNPPPVLQEKYGTLYPHPKETDPEDNPTWRRR